MKKKKIVLSTSEEGEYLLESLSDAFDCPIALANDSYVPLVLLEHNFNEFYRNR